MIYKWEVELRRIFYKQTVEWIRNFYSCIIILQQIKKTEMKIAKYDCNSNERIKENQDVNKNEQ